MWSEPREKSEKGLIYMQRKFLEDLGITDKETIGKILDENSEDIGKAKGELETVQTQLKEKEKEVETLQGQVKERNNQFETLKNSTGDIEQLKTQITTLQAENEEKEKAHEEEIKQIKIDNAIEKALTSAKAKNNIAVKALLKDAEKFELSEDGTVKGLQEQIDELVKGENTKFLFNSENEKQVFKGVKPGETGKEDIDDEVDLSKMSYDERNAYLNEHPEIEI